MWIDFQRKVVGLDMIKEQTTTKPMDMEGYKSTSGGTTYQTTTAHYLKTCPHRLPCGYCRLLMQNCPKDNNIKVTW